MTFKYTAVKWTNYKGVGHYLIDKEIYLLSSKK